MAKEAGTISKRSQTLLKKLESDHDFHVVRELLEVYGYNKKLYIPLFNTMIENMAATPPKPLTADMSEQEVNLFHMLNKELMATLQRLLAYLYPKLKAMELKHGSGENIIFNINTMPEVELKVPKSD